MAGWNVTEYEDFVNLKPIADLRIHKIGSECWCKPSIKLEDGYKPIVVHNSVDKRELYEYDNPANNPL